MAAQMLRFPVFDASGNAVTTATPTFVVYKGANGADRTPPHTTVPHVGEGVYGDEIRSGDVDAGVVFLIDCGAAAFPRYYAGFAGRVFAFATVDSTGALLTGQVPAFVTNSYRGSSGTTVAAPSFTSTAGLHFFSPSEVQYREGVSFLIDCGAGADPQYLGGFVQDPAGFDAPGAGGDVVISPVTPSRYGRQLQQLLPRGSLWRTDADAWLMKSLVAIGDELGRVEDRGVDLINEADPRTADETLEDWEAMLGLPDEEVPTLPATTAGRRLAVTQKFVRQGGQTAAYFIALAAACGYTATVYDAYGATVFRAGHRAGERCAGALWAYAWKMIVQPPSGTALTHAEFEACIRKAAPSHTTVVFEYL
jgi:uncharacterized protein YmfQ (DUF2313 family)